MTRLALALDLGGTNLRLAAVGEDGKVYARAFEPTLQTSDGDEIVGQIVRLAGSCSLRIPPGGDVFAIAAAVPATIDQSAGVLGQLPNVPALEGVPLRRLLREALAIDVVLENDANAAAYGENWLGASRGIDDSVCITLGTGVGGGLILGQKLFRGKDNTAGELGHIIVEAEGVRCGCGGRGCIEQYASATAIMRMAAEAGIDVKAANELSELAMAGDEVAMSIYERMGCYLGVAITSMVNLLNPEMIVIGGGVAAAWDLFIGAVNTQLRERAFRRPAERVRIVRARLGDDAGILGAARIAFSQIGMN